MRALEIAFVLAGMGAAAVAAAAPAQAESLEAIAQRCAPDVHPQTLKGLVTTESTGNPFAIGVVGGKLDHQPRNLEDALAAVQALERAGYNFSLGLAQVNRYNLARYGQTYASIFEPCANLRTGSAILKDCYTRARPQFSDDQSALRAAFSCYYSGNFTRGFKSDRTGDRSYVQKVVDNAVAPSAKPMVVPAVEVRPGEALPVAPAITGPTSGAQRQRLGDSTWVIFPDAQGTQDAEPDASVFKARKGAGAPAAGASRDRRQAPDTPFVQILE